MEEPGLCGSGGPLRSPCRRGPQTTPSCCGQSRGGERRGKSRAQARQVWITKASASEPLMKRRNNLGDIKTRESFRPWDESGGCLLIG